MELTSEIYKSETLPKRDVFASISFWV